MQGPSPPASPAVLTASPAALTMSCCWGPLLLLLQPLVSVRPLVPWGSQPVVAVDVFELAPEVPLPCPRQGQPACCPMHWAGCGVLLRGLQARLLLVVLQVLKTGRLAPAALQGPRCAPVPCRCCFQAVLAAVLHHAWVSLREMPGSLQELYLLPLPWVCLPDQQEEVQWPGLQQQWLLRQQGPCQDVTGSRSQSPVSAAPAVAAAAVVWLLHQELQVVGHAVPLHELTDPMQKLQACWQGCFLHHLHGYHCCAGLGLRVAGPMHHQEVQWCRLGDHSCPAIHAEQHWAYGPVALAAAGGSFLHIHQLVALCLISPPSCRLCHTPQPQLLCHHHSPCLCCQLACPWPLHTAGRWGGSYCPHRACPCWMHVVQGAS